MFFVGENTKQLEPVVMGYKAETNKMWDMRLRNLLRRDEACVQDPRHFRISFLCFFTFVLLVFVGCHGGAGKNKPKGLPPRTLSIEQSKYFSPTRLNYVAIFPLRAPVAEQFETGVLENLTEQLISAFAASTSLEIANLAAEQKVKSETKAALARQEVLRKQAEHFGRAVDAQGVLYGVLSKYPTNVEVSGSKLGGYSPAGVGFSLWLLDLERSEIVWSAKFELSQQPISENIFGVSQALSSGVGYRDAQQLAVRGFREAGAALESLRVQAREASAGE